MMKDQPVSKEVKHRRIRRLKTLLLEVPHGFIVDTRWLNTHGMDSKSIHHYLKRGYLERIMRGVYRRPMPSPTHKKTDEVPPQVMLRSLQWIMNYGVHLGGRTALEYRGYVHYLPLGSHPLYFIYGTYPSWVKSLPVQATLRLRSQKLFGADTTGIFCRNHSSDKYSAWRSALPWPIRMSCPERAVLELIDEILPISASFDFADKIIEMLHKLDPDLMMDLLQKCRSVKVRRLFCVYADLHEFSWWKKMDQSRIDLGSGPRHFSLEDGQYHPKYKIYVPRRLVDPTDHFMEGYFPGWTEHGV